MRIFTAVALAGLMALSVPVASASAGVMGPGVAPMTATRADGGIIKAQYHRWHHHEWRHEYREQWHPEWHHRWHRHYGYERHYGY